jgi:hypothetical protein
VLATTQARRARAPQVRRRSAAHEELTRRHCALLAEAAAAGDPCAAPGRLHRALAAALEVREPPLGQARGADLRMGEAGGRPCPALLHALNSLTDAPARSAQLDLGRRCWRAPAAECHEAFTHPPLLCALSAVGLPHELVLALTSCVSQVGQGAGRLGSGRVAHSGVSNMFPPPPGAQAYPRSAALLGALARAELRARTGARLRRTLADAAAAAPAAATALLSLRCEAALPAAGYRMQARLCGTEAEM